ncbi:MAG: hypothetical protein EAZ20_07480 [Bacteroidetes bacterium]|nr:MAG: hypothetical protein EAZ20_07480 [Bacteroidota bacterium]
MNTFDDIKLYLPKYLSEESTKDLFDKLGKFPDNISNSLYSNSLSEETNILQGDGMRNFLVINLPEEKVGQAPVIILSNTCDIDLNNSRGYFSSQIVYATIFNLDKYKNRLIENKIKDINSVEQHLDSIRKQLITQILYLPIGGGLKYEGIVFLDRICHCDNKSINRTDVKTRRLFSLSNYGFYLFLLKLSIHFTRIQEKVDRK